MTICPSASSRAIVRSERTTPRFYGCGTERSTVQTGVPWCQARGHVLNGKSAGKRSVSRSSGTRPVPISVPGTGTCLVWTGRLAAAACCCARRAQRCRLYAQHPCERLRQPPVPAAEQDDKRGHEQRPDHGRVENDSSREADAELLDVDARAAREHEEREHQHEGRARDQLPSPREAELDRLAGVADLVVLLAHASEHEDLVVHREPVEEREDHQWDPGDDHPGGGDAPDRVRSVTPLEDEDDDSVG